MTTVFLDLHALITAALQIGGAETQHDLAGATRGISDRTDIVAAFATASITPGNTATLVFSEYAMETLRRKLIEDEDGLDPQSAERTAGIVGSMVKGTAGELYTTEQLKAVLPRVKNLVADHIGNAKGQVDYEDLMVLAGCLLAAEQFGSCVLVTDDHGLLNCARSLAYQNIGIMNVARYHRASKAA